MEYYSLYIIFKKFLPNICFFANIYLYIVMIMYFIKLILILVFNVCVSIYYINCNNCKCCKSKQTDTGSGSKCNSNILPGKGGLEDGGLGGVEQEQKEEGENDDEDLKRKEEEKIKEQQRIKEEELKRKLEELKRKEEEKKKLEEEEKKRKEAEKLDEIRKKEEEEEKKKLEDLKMKEKEELKRKEAEIKKKKEELESKIRYLNSLLPILCNKMCNKKFESINIPSTGSRGSVNYTYSNIESYFNKIKDIEEGLKSVNTEGDINEIYTKIDNYNSIIDNYSSIIKSIKNGIDTACDELKNEIDKFRKQSESILTTISSTEEKINKCPELKKYIKDNLHENHGDILKQIGNDVKGVISRLNVDINTDTLKRIKKDILPINEKLNKFLEKIKEYEEIKAYNEYLYKSCDFLASYCINRINESEILYVKNGYLMGVYTKMAQNYAMLDEEDVDKVITKDGNSTYRSLKEKIKKDYEYICALFNEINKLLDEVQKNLRYENYIANTIEEVRKRKVDFGNKYTEIKRNFEEKCDSLLYLYHWCHWGKGITNINLDKRIIGFSNLIEKKLNKK